MTNNRTRLIVGIIAIIAVAGVAFWLSNRTPAEGPAPVPVATTSLPALSSTTPEASSGGTAPAVTQTVWQDFSNDLWKITLKWQTSWKTSAVPTEDGDLLQLSIGGKYASYFVSRNLPIAEPSGKTATAGTRVVAGKTVQVRDFLNPNENYVSYEYFSLPVGKDTYYFQIKEKTGAAKEVNDFLGFVTIK